MFNKKGIYTSHIYRKKSAYFLHIGLQDVPDNPQLVFRKQIAKYRLIIDLVYRNYC